MSDRRLYSDKIRYMARKNAGAIQKMTGVPASLIHRIREGEVRRLSLKVEQKLERAYNRYFFARMKKGGVNTDESAYLLRTGTRFDIYAALREANTAARMVRDFRRHRDQHHKKFRKSWHTTKDVKMQMAKDYKRNVGDWVKYVKGVFAVRELPAKVERDVTYTPRRMPKYTLDKHGHRRLSEKWTDKYMKGEDE